jgi:ubiquinone/menaquinone biosynthesis C-methylase UbiE
MTQHKEIPEEEMFAKRKIKVDSSQEDLRDAYLEYSKILTERDSLHWISLPNFSIFIESYAFRLVSNYIKQTHSSILDVGSGRGLQANYWKDKGFARVEACDVGLHFAPDYINRCIPFKTIDLNDKNVVLPYNDNEFDVVTCSHVLEHLKYPDKVVKECVRVSKDLVILTSPLGTSHWSESHIQFWNSPRDIAYSLMRKNWAFSIEFVISNIVKDIGAVIYDNGKAYPKVRQMCFIAVVYKQFNSSNDWMWGNEELIIKLRESRAGSFLYIYPEDNLFGDDDDEITKNSV